MCEVFLPLIKGALLPYRQLNNKGELNEDRRFIERS